MNKTELEENKEAEEEKEESVENEEKKVPEPKSILKNKQEESPKKKPKKTKSSKLDMKAKIKAEMEQTNISSLDITSNDWIKENILTGDSEFPGWKKAIKTLLKSLEGKDALKKKFKKCLRKAYEISSSSKKRPGKS
eukprot:CAMPEP_0197005772 /NCGR_PEP_ID=MMETSP1380-20130617/31220_1 /TAXON_ID=5936 /ORGANISM="Euplotes crassus, Strain CT5" /LENGTH=136 /DNA_ID=CAMNT_0042425037 /DNA_START=254 /DNA_END=665 /DNA_ORIENTATION=-